MAASSGPDIIDDGLIFCVDAKNTKCYTGSGSTLTDLVGTSTGTINNTTFDASGYFDFDGTNDSISFTAPTNAPTGDEARTICSWIQMGHETNRMQAFGYGAGSSYRTFSMEISSYGATDKSLGLHAWDLIWESTTLLTLNTWHYCTIAYAGGTVNSSNLKLYIDGQDAGLNRAYGADNVTLNTPAENFKFGERSSGSDLDYNGLLSTIHFYNRQLTAEEVLQNYNAHKGRFT
tara:strand:- start:276 stop:974 length:699 start_codon:yes stop_codon:yes gene_type:complete